ncbi:MAG: cobS [Klenkia sp.]|nr:cobS [Klenkia sp.]
MLGDLASVTGWLGAWYASPPVGTVLGVALLAWLTRGLHLDGLADTADGLGPLRGRERALAVTRSGYVGPFGVATLVLTLPAAAVVLGRGQPTDTRSTTNTRVASPGMGPWPAGP